MNKRLKLIYNPAAGRGKVQKNLDQVINVLQTGGWQVVVYRTGGSPEETAGEAERACTEGCTAVVAAGGDGTFHQVVNGLMRVVANGQVPPALGLIPAGTANDFANNVRIPGDIGESCRVIVRGKTRSVDVGRLDRHCFFNVAAGGLTTDISYKVNPRIKNRLGKLAYYLKSVELLPQFRPFSLRITLLNGELVYDGQTLLFLVLNSKGAGGFPLIAPQAQINDGLLDLVVFRLCKAHEFVSLFLRVLRGEHVHSPLVTYRQAPGFVVNGPPELETDLDGEMGPPFPWTVGVYPAALRVFIP
ncbi:MAG: YegS/Rv2252/BmrU family lipid kinase [Heliobacteriaceae bacterium]|nr:YegS/Rv2252/BmrU family lipid kinase [Heliobacteriaceae bacterium]MDD4587541.1 YegS/Rv2252/BmrU family lipid kinase [Heliobacteriaceae bacterium]